MFKVATWNVNSVNSRLTRLLDFLKRESPDVLCLQELKCLDEKFPGEAITAAGYSYCAFGQKTYNGVAILSKEPLTDIQRGFEDGVEDSHSRFLMGRYKDVWVSSAYIPNGKAVGDPAYDYKLKWLKRLKSYLSTHFTPKDSIIVAGDFNVAPEERDVHDPHEWEGKILFSGPEKAALREVMEFGLIDTFRVLHPDKGQYSWWDYRGLSFPFNKGLRIDFVFATEPLAARVVAAAIDRNERKGEKPSDHAPCITEFKM